MKVMEIKGVVLAGGLSSRFGSCKSKLCLDSQSILQNTYSLLLRHCKDVRISCRKEQEIQGYPCIYDTEISTNAFFDLGENSRTFYAPMVGIYGALKHFTGPVLVLSCDLPFVDDATIAQLLAERNLALAKAPQTLMTTFRREGTHFIEALVAIYEYAAMPVLQKALEQKKFSLSRAIPEENRCHIITHKDKPFFNINYPQDLTDAENIFLQQDKK